jgi:hypothetical protein
MPLCFQLLAEYFIVFFLLVVVVFRLLRHVQLSHRFCCSSVAR